MFLMDKTYIKLKVKDYDKLLKFKRSEFLLSIQISRLINALRIILKRIYEDNLQQESSDKLIHTKNTVDLLILLSSTLYEVIKTYKKDIEKKIPQKILSKVNSKKYIDLKNKYDYQNPDNFCKILKEIRNKLSFHFDEDIVKKYIDNTNLKEEENYILISTSERIIDTFFCLPYDIALSHLDDLGSTSTKNFMFNEFKNQVYTESVFLSEFFEYLIIDLLKDHYYKIVESL